MAVPSLAAMAGLTLFHNPHLQPADVSIDYSDLGKFASVIQRRQRQVSRRRGIISRAATRINALFRAFSVRCYFVGFDPSRIFTPPIWMMQSGGSHFVGTRRLRLARRSARLFMDGEAWLNDPMNLYDYEHRLRLT